MNGSFNLSEGAFSDSSTKLVIAYLKLALFVGLTVHYSYNLLVSVKNIKTWSF